MERRVQPLQSPQRFQSRVSCQTIEAYFLHQELKKWFPFRSKADVLLSVRADEAMESLSWLVIESPAPLSLDQRKFLASCGLVLADVQVVEATG
jgi:hypothetical protein